MLTEVVMGGETGSVALTLEDDPVPDARRLSKDPAERILRTVRPANDGCGRGSSSSVVPCVSLDGRGASADKKLFRSSAIGLSEGCWYVERLDVIVCICTPAGGPWPSEASVAVLAIEYVETASRIPPAIPACGLNGRLNVVGIEMMGATMRCHSAANGFSSIRRTSKRSSKQRKGGKLTSRFRRTTCQLRLWQYEYNNSPHKVCI